MPTSPEEGLRQRRAFRLRELLSSWWQHRASFVISVGITIFALLVYIFTFVGDRRTPLFDFLKRFEYDTLDTRFRYRPARYTPPDSRIVVVAVDQRSQEVLGKWPFSRKYFGQMLDALHDDGAKVASFDVTFDKPDQTSAPIRALLARLQQNQKEGKPLDPAIESQVQKLAREFDADAQFAAALRRFGPVVLGNFYLPSEEVKGIDSSVLDKYAEMVQWYSLNRNALVPTSGKPDFRSLLQNYQFEGTLYSATIANIAELAPADNDEKTSIGFFNISSDADGVLRRALLILPFGRTTNPDDFDLYGSLEVQTVRQYLGGLKTDQLTVNYGPAGIASIQFADKLRVKPDYLGRVLINYRGPGGTYPYYSLADVVQHKFAPGTFKNKIVIVGASATGIGDLRTPPYGGINYPGLEVHANVIDNMLNNAFLIRGPDQELLDLLLIVLFGIPLGIALALVSPRWMWFGLALLIPFAALVYLAFLHGWWLNFTLPAGTLTANVMAVSLYRALVEEKEKRKVRTAFGQYLSPEVIRRLLVNPQLVEPRKTEITVMFSDIRGFTTISEKLDAQELALFLNGYLSDMTKIVFDSHGTLDKYIGDAVMAFWGAPYEESGHASQACEAALAMMKRVRELQQHWEEGKPKLDIGIGLNSGVASVGNMGSALRYGYTALGDAVNLSSRLEGLNKDYGTHILLNESTYMAAKDTGFVFREIDSIRVKGKLQPVQIYELLGSLAELQRNGSWLDLQQRLKKFSEARAYYQRRDWGSAQPAFQEMLDRWPDDGPSRTYWKRCQDYLFDEPPPSWDGVFTMDHK